MLQEPSSERAGISLRMNVMEEQLLVAVLLVGKSGPHDIALRGSHCQYSHTICFTFEEVNWLFERLVVSRFP